MTTELAVVLAPWLIGCVGLVVFAGRMAQAEGDVRAAAQEAARAATLAGDPGTAVAAGEQVGQANLAASRMACVGGGDIDVNTGGFGPGDYVTVTVTCTADFRELVGLGVPGSRQFVGQATEIIDQYRGDP